MAIQENGTIDGWGLKDTVISEDDDGNSIHSDVSLEQYDKFFEIISKYLTKADYHKIHNSKQGESENSGYVMADGTQIVGIYLQPSRCNDDYTYCGDFYIKTDGKPYYDANKKFRPNIFVFKLEPYKISPIGTDDRTFKNFCLNGENYSRCTGWVILNGNMDYLHCRDLSINGKTKCK